jgi:hypothetical protein
MRARLEVPLAPAVAATATSASTSASGLQYLSNLGKATARAGVGVARRHVTNHVPRDKCSGSQVQTPRGTPCSVHAPVHQSCQSGTPAE